MGCSSSFGSPSIVRLVRVYQPIVQVPRVDLIDLRLDLLRYLREYLPFHSAWIAFVLSCATS